MTDASRRALLALASATPAAALASRVSAHGTARPGSRANAGRAAIVSGSSRGIGPTWPR